jgi:hypothetical protein
MQQAKYINDLLCECAPDNGFAQEAIEYAILRGDVLLAFDEESDKYQVMRQYDEIIDKYREVQSRHATSLANMNKSTACVEEVLVGC